MDGTLLSAQGWSPASALPAEPGQGETLLPSCSGATMPLSPQEGLLDVGELGREGPGRVETGHRFRRAGSCSSPGLVGGRWQNYCTQLDYGSSGTSSFLRPTPGDCLGGAPGLTPTHPLGHHPPSPPPGQRRRAVVSWRDFLLGACRASWFTEPCQPVCLPTNPICAPAVGLSLFISQSKNMSVRGQMDPATQLKARAGLLSLGLRQSCLEASPVSAIPQ